MRILLPVDGSALALDAVRHALRLVEEGLSASFVLANVQEPATLYEMMTVHDTEALERVQEGAAAHALEGAQALLRAAGAPFEVETGSGEVAHTLLDIAERQGCDAIVLGARGTGGLGGFGGRALGSVAQTLLHDSTLPLTLVKHPDDDTEQGTRDDDADFLPDAA